jgi:hypothetical protein
VGGSPIYSLSPQVCGPAAPHAHNHAHAQQLFRAHETKAQCAGCHDNHAGVWHESGRLQLLRVWGCRYRHGPVRGLSQCVESGVSHAVAKARGRSHTHTHTHTRTHTHTQNHTHTHTHRNTRTHTHTHTRARARMRTHAQTRTRTHTHIPTNPAAQWLEVPYDSQMRRTCNRPLVRGALQPHVAVTLAALTGVAGGALLFATSNALTAGLGVANIVLYAGL